ESVCPSCANGCNIKLGMFRNEIQRLVPRRNDAVHDTWMCDHGRLNYHFAHDETRVRVPRVDRHTTGPDNGSRPAMDTAGGGGGGGRGPPRDTPGRGAGA